MTHRHAEHARKVVDQFRERIEQGEAATVSDDHLDELALMVESAITTVVLEQMEKSADQVESLAREMRQDAERFS